METIGQVLGGVVVALVVLLLFYLAGAACYWSFDPGVWSIEGRSALSVIGFIVAAVAGSGAVANAR